MGFNLEQLFADVFNPQPGDVILLLHDLPHGEIKNNSAWDERRKMAADWHSTLNDLAGKWDVRLKPLTTYQATGTNNADLPTTATIEDKEMPMNELLGQASIVVVMPEFSATAPLYQFAKKSDKLRVGSMPGVAKFMEESGLSADYKKIQRRCKALAPIMERAIAAEVSFSTGQKCYFDLSLKENHAHIDDGFLHRETAGTDKCLSNLPAGEVYIVPNENPDSKTAGKLPQMLDGQLAVYQVKNNKIVGVKGDGAKAAEMRKKFEADKAWCNLAEFAVGLNDKAKVTGIVLEDEKAGFHWAYGRSDHFGGQVGVKDFTSPGNVVHQDIVYAKDSPIQCSLMELIFEDGTRQTAIKEGEVLV